MKTQNVIGTTSVEAAADLTRLRFVGFDGDVAAEDAAAIGVCEADTGSGEMAPVNTHGVLLVEAGGVIALGAEVEVDGSGKAVTIAAGVSQGRAMDAAAADGDIIRILR